MAEMTGAQITIDKRKALQAQRDQLETILRDPRTGGKYGRMITQQAKELDRQLLPYYKVDNANSAASPLTGASDYLKAARDKKYAGSDYDPSTDTMLQSLLSKAPNSAEDQSNLEAYVSTQHGKNKIVHDREFGEAGVRGAYEDANVAGMALAQGPLQQELARLGILNGGALTANTQQIAQQQNLAVGNNMSQYRTDGTKDLNTLTTNQMQALNDLRAQQRSQAIAGFMQQGQQNAQRHQANRMLPWQIAGSAMQGIGAVKGIW